MGLQAKTLAQAKIRHWPPFVDVPGVICSNRAKLVVGAWFSTMCKYMGMRHAKTVAYHSRSKAGAEWRAGNCSKSFSTCIFCCTMYLLQPRGARGKGTCILVNLAEMGIIPFGGLYRDSTIYTDRLVCQPIISYSFRIEFHILSHRRTMVIWQGRPVP